ncbi:MAG TPA: MBL fold metallo-hydrolase [Jatrophihabitantaceae bacterium]|jgi:L-ascorbate metabolism protein UlaG (beta-lactamase superfamily)|nr:MBL fold metallo-hydrolase [Jatrophihabitantaceae bacterium]
MQLTKFTHACVRFDDGDRALVIDPGVFSEVEQALDGVDAVLITHEHADHLDADRLRAAAKANPRLRIWAPSAVTESLADLGEQAVAVGAGESFDAGGFAVRTFGGQHAVIHPSIPVIANVGYLIENSVYHPGDSFTVPSAPVATLLVPLNAPWSKAAEVIDFVISVRAPKVHPVHDVLLTDVGRGIVEGHVSRIGAEHGSEYAYLAPGATVSA